MNPPRKRILVTGASGMLGREIVRALLEQGARPVIQVRHSSRIEALEPFCLDTRFADLRRPAELARLVEGVDCVIHAAAKVNFRGGRLTEFRAVNTGGPVELFRAARRAGARRFVHVSSITAVGAAPRGGEEDDGAVVCEDHPFNLGHLRIPYIQTKRAAEVELLRLAREGGPELVLVNPSMILAPPPFGGYVSRAATQLARSIVPDLPNRLNVVDVRDVAAATIAAVRLGRPGERYLLAGQNLPARELFHLAAQVQGRKPRVVPVRRGGVEATAFLGELVGFVVGRGRVPLYRDLVKLLDYDWAYSSEKARRELAFDPRPIRLSLEQFLGPRAVSRPAADRPRRAAG